MPDPSADLAPGVIDDMLHAAASARANACCEYSGFSVGAALLDGDGRVHIGVNVESSSFGGTICAERVALTRALADGVRDFRAIAVVTGASHPVMPCGQCRQLLHDYAPTLIVIAAAGGATEVISLAALLPHAFGREDLEPTEGGASTPGAPAGPEARHS